jgi:hypothetical protein
MGCLGICGEGGFEIVQAARKPRVCAGLAAEVYVDESLRAGRLSGLDRLNQNALSMAVWANSILRLKY